eukprot:6224968-Heterocapsa_arctica.AAC.1
MSRRSLPATSSAARWVLCDYDARRTLTHLATTQNMSNTAQAWAAKCGMVKSGPLAARCPAHSKAHPNSPTAAVRSTLMVRSAALLAGFPLRSSAPSNADLKIGG